MEGHAGRERYGNNAKSTAGRPNARRVYRARLATGARQPKRRLTFQQESPLVVTAASILPKPARIVSARCPREARSAPWPAPVPQGLVAMRARRRTQN